MVLDDDVDRGMEFCVRQSYSLAAMTSPDQVEALAFVESKPFVWFRRCVRIVLIHSSSRPVHRRLPPLVGCGVLLFGPIGDVHPPRQESRIRSSPHEVSYSIELESTRIDWQGGERIVKDRDTLGLAAHLQ